MIIPIILAGGLGKRLWPLSNKDMPKQFLPIINNKSLFQHAIENAKEITDGPMIIVCNQNYYDIINKQISNLNMNLNIHIIIEKFSYNTSFAISIACNYINDKWDKSYTLVLPTDHYIENINLLKDEIKKLSFIDVPNINLFGIKPYDAEINYGYIKKGQKTYFKSNLYKIDKFIEKPDLATAKEFYNSQEYLWNSGIIFAKANKILRDMKIHSRETYDASIYSLKNAIKESNNIILGEKTFPESIAKSIDVSLFEKNNDILVSELNLKWKDLGSWSNISNLEHVNDSTNNLFMKDCNNSYFYSSFKPILALGVNDSIVVETCDAILVASKDKSSLIKNFVNDSRDMMKCTKPWGKYEIISQGMNFKIKMLTINPGHKISMQLHHKRSENWNIVSGSGKLFLSNEIIELSKEQHVFIPKNTKHRVENIGSEFLKILEVQMGDYLEEDDIVRFEDEYGRV